MWVLSLARFHFLVLLNLIHFAACDYFNQQPRIISSDGHVIFQAADNRNITLKYLGSGSIRVNDDDLVTTIETVKRTALQLTQLKQEDVATLHLRIQEAFEKLEQFAAFTERLHQLETSVATLSSLVQNSTRTITGLNTRSNLNRNRIRVFQRRLNTIQRLLSKNECASNPCRNGGKCEDIYNGYICRCPDYWQGVTCEDDVNECALFTGTPRGCQNGATCVNLVGSYECQCTANWHGVHCDEKHDDCTGASSQELCGHGLCHNVERVQPGMPKYECLCDEGWNKTSGSNPACVVDIDECSWPRYPCSLNPKVSCYNTHGTYFCGECPPGYIGNGHTCEDVNECLVNNGGCSMNPVVHCTNTYGSRRCEPCPQGYQGDGIICSQVNVCLMNNGGCSSLAVCIVNLAMIGGRECRCGPGYVGSGLGPYGCTVQEGGHTSQPGVFQNPCDANPCVHGTCTLYGVSYHCACQPGYMGINCETQLNPCASNPCANGGSCVAVGMGYTCTCASGFTGNNCQDQQQGCGGHLSSSSGNLRYPLFQGDDYLHNQDCVWLIETTWLKVVNLTFSEFHLEEAPVCAYDFLQINDGPSITSNIIGVYCGVELPGNIVSHTETLRVWLHSDHSNAGKGFKLNWEPAEPLCGDHRDAEYGLIQSPGYPGKYSLNRDCYWTITVPAGKKISFQFHTLKLEHHFNCSFDFLEIRNGLSINDPLLARYCQTYAPEPMITPGRSVLLHFHSDEINNDFGFHITYTSIPAIPGCGGEYTAPSGIISSPEFPNNYANGLECDWHISAQNNERIKLTFTNFNLEDNFNCAYDFVQIWDGPNTHSPSINTYCGNVIPPSVRSSSSHLVIKFRSDESDSFTGFRAEYELLCGGDYSDSTGSIHSPFYPNPYPESKECIYRITQPVGKLIVLEFEAFDLESDYQGDVLCHYDYLEIRDGFNEKFPLRVTLCGEKSPEPIVSTQNVLWLKFVTDSSQQNKGFLAHYRTEDIQCGGMYLNELNGTITSPDHPMPYPHDTLCRWVIQVPAHYIISFRFLIFNLEDSDTCHYDYVEVFDNITLLDKSGHSVGKFCGTVIPAPILSMGDLMTVVFKTDESQSVDGFFATFEAVNNSNICGRNYINQVGFLSSPNYPNGYSNDLDCTWIIKVPSMQQIEINITELDLERHGQCEYDYLEIRNGGTQSSPLLGQYCSLYQVPGLIRSYSNQLYIHFHSDYSNNGKGFNLIWDGTLLGCSGVLTTASGTLTSPNYPIHYDHNVLCEWHIAVSHGSRIKFIIVDLDIEDERDCLYDYLEIAEKSLNKTSKKFCGDLVPLTPLFTAANAAVIRFLSEGSVNGRGFSLRFETECNNNIMNNGRHGVIESPNFPDAYPHNQNCTWTIQAPWGNKIRLVFSHLSLERSRNCSYDKLEIRDSTEPPKVVGRYCTLDVPPDPVTSESELLSINFISDHDAAYDGFRLEWFIIGCGGNYMRNEGNLSYPEDANHLPRVICEWSISVDYGHQVKLVLDKFDLDFLNCNGNSLQIFGGPDVTSPKLTEPLCHKSSNPLIFTSMGNHVFLRYSRSVMARGSGFTASWTAIEGGCSHHYSSPTGYINSPNYPNSYNMLDDCSWLITVDEFHTIALTFQDFQLELDPTCQYDYVAIFDGVNEEAERIFFYCGAMIPTNIIRSSSNNMYIRFKADGSHQSKGFNANYSMDCGGVLNANEGGIISISPSFITYSYSPNCTWLIKAENLGDQVTLAITELRILDSRRRGWNCSMGFVRVYDGDSEFAPELGTYCRLDAPPPITSDGNALYVVLTKGRNHTRSNFFANSISFTANYYESSSSCGSNYTSDSGAFSSPGYPNGYPLEIECIWFITAPPGNRIQLSFSLFNIEDSENCNLDYLEIHEVNASGPLLGNFCGDEIPSNLTASESFWIKFRSDDAGTAVGFMAIYKFLSENEITGTGGKIASPLYPHFSNINGIYRWHIIVPMEMLVQVEFEDFSYNRTLFRSMTFYDGSDQTAPVLKRLRGINLPEPFYSTGNELVFVYPTAHFSQSRFLLSWKAVYEIPPTEVSGDTAIWTASTSSIPGCGGHLWVHANSTATNLTSPGYPNGYQSYLNCEWILQTEPGNRIALKFIDVDLVNYYYKCYYDGISIYDGENGMESWSAEPIQTVCERDSEGTYVNSSGHFMKVVFRSNYENRTGFLIRAESKCGGYFYKNMGLVLSPNYPNDYLTNQNCEWLITVKPGRTILIRSHYFDIEDTDACTDDYILFRNGATKNSPLLNDGKYCNNHRPTPSIMNTTSNHLYIKFVSDNKGSNRGFRLFYEEQSISCGGHIILSPGVPEYEFTTPNFPRIPPPHSECKWIITAPAAHRVQLDFDSTFDITDSDNCSTEFVEGYDGGTINSHLLFKKCGRQAPETSWSFGNTMLIRYFTDTDNEGSGFKATAKISVCGGTLVTKQGIITTPDYPAPYPNDLNCEWKVRGPTGHYISFQPVNYALPYAANCSQATHVSIRDYDDKELKTYCGTMHQNVAVNTSDNQGSLLFKSTTNVERYSGFKFTYNTSVDSCGGERTTPSGIITSPNFPGLYPHKQRCFWRITVPEGRRIRLEFTAFDLEEKSHYPDDRLNCIDQVMLYDGAIGYSPRLSPSLCGSTLPPVYHTSGNGLVMYLFTDGDSTGSGFSLTYTSDEPAVCGGEISTFPKQLSSPTGLSTENVSIHCIWQINSPELANTSIMFDISDFSVEEKYSVDFQCFEAFFKIFIGPDVDGSILVHDLCGNLTDKHIFVVPASSLWLRYKKSLTQNSTRGFNLTASIQNCGGVITNQEFTLVSPNYPNNYGQNVHCAWAITVEEEQQIKLTFDEFNLDENSKDYLVIYNGLGPEKSPKFGHFNATYKPSSGIHSMGNSLWIEFHSDPAGGGRGFKATGSADSGGCSGHYNADKGSVTSLNFPNRYPNNLECIWEITLSYGYHGDITFVDRFDVQTVDSCSKDFVAIYEEIGNEWKQIGNNLCGKQLPQPIKTKSNKFKVMFQTDDNINGDGFKLKWDKGCGGEYNESSNKIYSPGFPQEYSTYLTCDYLIMTEPDHYIQLTFDENFDIENETSCTWDSVEIFSGMNERGTSLGKYCGTIAPSPLVIKGGAAFVRFKSDSIVVKKGFVLNYNVQKCGGNLTDSSGTFQSPTHPMTYFPNTRCTWTIRGGEGLYVEVVFIKFDMEDIGCNYDYVKLYDGDSLQSPLIGTYCGTHQKPLRVLSKSDVITVQFVSDDIIHHFGFLAVYRSTFGEKHGCGGYKNVSSGSISSLDHDNNGFYEPDLTCIWVVETQENHKNLKITFDKFDIEAPDDLEKGCPWDYLEIRDGTTEYSRLIDRYCGTTVPNVITSSGKSLWIKFSSDSSHNKAGFTLNYISIEAPCSDNLVATNYSKDLVSPDYPYGYPPNTRCEWNITADRPGSIELIFKDFELENSTKCSKDYLEVRDDMNDEMYNHWGLQLEGIYCGKNIPHHFLSYYPKVKLNFATDNTLSSTGFKLTYKLATCNYSYGEDEDNGRIRMNLKNFFQTDACVISISATEGKTIALYFVNFEISWSINCTDGYMKVFDGKAVSDPVLETTCGYYEPNPIFSTGNNLLLIFKPPGTYYRNLIDISFTTTDQGVGCGGTLSGINGSLSSPYYPGNYSVNKDCQWIIQVPPAAAVQLYFRDIDLTPSTEQGTSCNTHVSVYDGREAILNKRVAHYCDTINYSTERTIHGSDNEILVQYVSNVNNTGRGFKAIFQYNGWKELIPDTFPKD